MNKKQNKYIVTLLQLSVADPECARGGGVSHILAEKRGVSFTLFKMKMHENLIFSLIAGGGGRRTPGTPYAGSATDYNYLV